MATKKTRSKGLSTSTKVFVGIGVLTLFFILWIGTSYNNLVSLQTSVDEQWSNVEAQYQRRIDLIPNLVATVKAYAAHETDVFTELARLRSQWQTAPTIDAKVQTAQQIDGALGRLIAVAENYPQLQSSQNFLSLQDELAGTENRIAVARTRYNGAVKGYNTAIRTVPRNLVASIFGFGSRASFTAQSGAEKVPTVTL